MAKMKHPAKQAAAKRPYDSSRRQAQAALTRLAMLDGAERRFVADGYVATTVEAVAAEAGVALKTVYSAFGTKSGLLRALWDVRLKGDADDAGVMQRAWFGALMAETDVDKQVRQLAGQARATRARIGPLLRVIRSAAVVDADAAALWSLIQSDFYELQRVLVAGMHKRRGLKKGLDVADATDILWTLNHPDVWLLLVYERGWSPERFEQWFVDAVTAQLLG